MIAVFTDDTGRVSRLAHEPTDEQESGAALTVQSVPDAPNLLGVESTSLFVVNGALEHRPTGRHEAEQAGDVSALKAWMKGRVDRIFEEKESGPVQVGGVTYPGDLASQSRVAGVIQQAKAVEAQGGTFTFNARDVQGEFHQLGLSNLKALRSAYGEQVQGARRVAKAHKADIDAASTVEALNAIDVTSKW